MPATRSATSSDSSRSTRKAPITILADTYQGKRLNSPNDLVYRSDGSLYFTDPPYGLRTQNDTDPEKELQVNGVYRIPHALEHKPGAPPARDELQLLITDLPRPNGIAFSPDEKYLYVNNSEPKKIWMRYRVQARRHAGRPQAPLRRDRRPALGGPDGMKVDVRATSTAPAPAACGSFRRKASRWQRSSCPSASANVAWAGPDRKTLYIAASTSIYRVRLKIAGEPAGQEIVSRWSSLGRRSSADQLAELTSGMPAR